MSFRAKSHDSATESAIGRLRFADALGKILGQAPAFVRVVSQLPAVAKGSNTVLITGETGTGKELVARAIHFLSERAALPFVPVNCGSLPDTLLEDDLFGHERGAFTDARTPRPGLLAQAGRGTLFLDEVECLAPRAQAALLRVLQDRRWRALGSSVEQQADVRFVAATNTPLQDLMKQGAFRADLYYRLCVLCVHLPPLRERREDILSLARHFLLKHAREDDRDLDLSPSAETVLLTWDWPGNVRELESAIIRAVQFVEGDRIEPDHLGLPMRDPGPGRRPSGPGSVLPPFQELKRRILTAFELDYLTRLMREHAGNVTRAARSAGKDRRELGKLLRRHNLDPQAFVRGR